MKFLCVECDEPMTLKETRGPDNGSLSVLFECGSCGKQTAMLTNAMETQMVHSLGVKVGGRKEAAAPMETLRGNLAGYAEQSAAAVAADSEPTGSRAGVVSPAEAGSEAASGAASEPAPHSPEWYAQKMGIKSSGEDSAGCPFSGMVAEQMEAAAEIAWTAEAEARMERIPSFVRGMVRKSIEDAAKSEGLAAVDVSVIERVRGTMGM